MLWLQLKHHLKRHSNSSLLSDQAHAVEKMEKKDTSTLKHFFLPRPYAPDFPEKDASQPQDR